MSKREFKFGVYLTAIFYLLVVVYLAGGFK